MLGIQPRSQHRGHAHGSTQGFRLREAPSQHIASFPTAALGREHSSEATRLMSTPVLLTKANILATHLQRWRRKEVQSSMCLAGGEPGYLMNTTDFHKRVPRNRISRTYIDTHFLPLAADALLFSTMATAVGTPTRSVGEVHVLTNA